MHTYVIYVLDEIVFALLESRNLFPNAMLQAAIDGHAAQQSTRMRLAFLPVWPERFNFGVLNIAAQNISQSHDIPSREFV